jgi:hypothetical protein
MDKKALAQVTIYDCLVAALIFAGTFVIANLVWFTDA